MERGAGALYSRAHGTGPGHARGALRGARPSWRRRHGSRLSRPRYAAHARSRHQGHPQGPDRRPRVDQPFRKRGPAARRAQPPEHRNDPWIRGGRGRAVARHGAGAGRDAGRAPVHGSGPRGRGDRHRPADRRRDRDGARPRNHPPRPEAREHQAHPRRHRESARLRSREGAGGPRGTLALPDGHLGRDARGNAAGHGGLHEPRAGSRQGRRRADGHLGVRLRAPRNADGPAGLRRRDALGHHRRDTHARAGFFTAPS